MVEAREREKILLVEDEKNVGSTLFERLEKEGFAVTWVRTAEDASLEVTSRPFDLAVLDVGLPDDSGFSVAKKIREQSPRTAILFLTAFGSPEERIHGLEMGAEDYVTKPFHLKELLLRIKNVLRRAHASAEDTAVPESARIGRAVIHFARFEAEVDGRPHMLTHKECAVLKMLVRHRGKSVSRDAILDEVWGVDEYPGSRTIDNFILRLRRLVEQDPENPQLIRSIRGVGYLLAEEEKQNV